MDKKWRWLLFLAAISGLVSNVAGLRATSLIFGRGPNGTLVPTFTTASTTAATTGDGSSTTSTTTIVPAILAGIANGTDSVTDDEQANETGEPTKPPLTGIPQIDYVWDPNLPHELNGYNLSTYPFLSLVPPPDDIDFKCDGLHDGFYASLKYSCQLYHHCIYGIRHDFLCANFTAFDQKTFICQFVSEVNCKASPKYFFRNDALYVAATTTSTTTTTLSPPLTQPQYYDRPQRPLNGRPLQRPLQRPRRPIPAQTSDYYYDDDEYDQQDDYADPPPQQQQRYSSRRRQQQQSQRSRTRRPVQQPEYADDEYAQPQQQQSQGRRFQDDYDRRPAQRNRNQKPAANSYEYDDDEEPEVEEPVRPQRKRGPNGNRPRNPQSVADDRDRYENGGQRRPAGGPQGGRKGSGKDQAGRRKPAGRPKQQPQRYDDDEDSADANAPDSDYDEPARPAPAPVGPQVSPSGGGSALFSRPRAAPRINRPVPLNDKRKFDYAATNKAAKPTSTTAATPAADEEAEYEEDYEEDAPAAAASPVDRSSSSSSSANRDQQRRPSAPVAKKPIAPTKKPSPVYEDTEEEDTVDEDVPIVPLRPQYKPLASSTASRKVQQTRLPAAAAAANQPQTKSRRPTAASSFADLEQDDEPAPPARQRPNRRPAAYAPAEEEDTIDDTDHRIPLRNNNSNQRPRGPLVRPPPALTGEGRAYSRKAPAAAEIYAEDEADEEEPSITPPPPPPAAPARKQLRQQRPKPSVAPIAVEANINDRRPQEENISSQKFRSQFRSREQLPRATSTTTTSTTTTTTTTPASILDEDEEYASDEYEDEEPIEEAAAPAPVRPATEAPARSALNKSSHRFAAPVVAAQPDQRPAPKQQQPSPNKYSPSSGRAAASSSSVEEYYEDEPSLVPPPPSVPDFVAPQLQMRPQQVRVVKRPFLPSRGGNPYLPRGLKPLGPVERDAPVYAEDDEPAVGGPESISGARLLEFHPPLVSREPQPVTTTSTTTTTTSTTTLPPPPLVYHQQHHQQQQIVDPNRKLEEIFSSELDVTLNDALNPTLKPLSRSSPIGFSFKYSPSYYEPAASRRESSSAREADDVAHQQTQIHQAAVHAPFYETTAGGQSRSAPMAAASAADSDFYSDYDY